MRAVLDGTVLVFGLVSLGLTPRVLGREMDARRSARCRVPPLAALAVVTGLIFLNQVFFTIYVLRVHGGDTSFIARYLPPGWFDLADGNRALRWLADSFPVPPSLLAPTVLRVQAFLELPFVLLAYATVVRWLDPALYRRVFRSPLLWLASASYTTAFCVVEWDLRNPYTVDDIVVRLVSAVATPAFMAALAARDEDTQPRPALTASGLVLCIASFGALSVLVLVVYDTALLYNLGRLDDRAPIGLAAAVALVLFRVAAAALRPRSAPGRAVTFLGHGLRYWLAFFFVSALAVRYGVTFGTPTLAVGAGLVLAGAAGGHALRETLTEEDRRPPDTQVLLLLGQLGCALLVGTAAAYTAVPWPIEDDYYEPALLQATSVFLVTTIAVCALTDALVRARRAA